jgi:hypothetical protein
LNTNLARAIILQAVLALLTGRTVVVAQPVKYDPRYNDPPVLYGYEEEPYHLQSGPHLLIDYRYIFPGQTDYFLPDGQDAPRYDGEEAALPEITSRPRRAPWGVRLEAQPADKAGIVLPNDKPWEYIHSQNSLKYWEGKYRMWYEIFPPRVDGDVHPLGQNVLCYAESEDGLHWIKPELGLIEFEGSKANNIVYGRTVSGHEFHGSSVWIDPQAPPESRFKLVYMATGTPVEEIAALKAAHPESVSALGERKNFMMRIASSPEGIHWTPQAEPLMSHIGDTQTRIFYDEITKSYVGYFRMIYMNRRAIGISGGRDLKHWPAPRLLLYPSPNHDQVGDDYYHNGYTLYPGTRTMHLMMVSIFKRYNDTLNVRLASSMDGRTWTWVPGDPVLAPGTPGDDWDGGCLFMGTELTELPDGRVAAPYWGYVYPHKHPRYERHMGNTGLAVWPKERLSALVADDEGEIYTVPLKADGRRLFLNFETAPNGFVRVGVDGGEGRKIEDCDPLCGNQLKQEVTWKGEDMSVKPGERFTLHLRLRQAKVFSFEIR